VLEAIRKRNGSERVSREHVPLKAEAPMYSKLSGSSMEAAPNGTHIYKAELKDAIAKGGDGWEVLNRKKRFVRAS
jgi:hypothetical protein